MLAPQFNGDRGCKQFRRSPPSWLRRALDVECAASRGGTPRRFFMLKLRRLPPSREGSLSSRIHCGKQNPRNPQRRSMLLPRSRRRKAKQVRTPKEPLRPAITEQNYPMRRLFDDRVVSSTIPPTANIGGGGSTLVTSQVVDSAMTTWCLPTSSTRPIRLTGLLD